MIDTTLQSPTQKPDLGPVTNERGRVWASFRLILIFQSLCFFFHLDSISFFKFSFRRSYTFKHKGGFHSDTTEEPFWVPHLIYQ